MGRKVIDLTGARYGMMTVVERDLSVAGGQHVSAHWIVKCDCGNVRSISANVLRSLHQESCGCLRGANLRRPPKYPGVPKQALQRWTNMMRRCYKPTQEKDKRNYMDRGIAVCKEWHDPVRFYQDTGNPPFPKATIDRIDNNRGYEPNNFRWADASMQNKNRRPFVRREMSHQHV